MDAPQPIPPPPSTAVPRFTMELEFVSCLANPAYLQYLGTNFHHLLNPPDTINPNPNTQIRASNNTTTKSSNSTSDTDPNSNTDAAKFARYLKYLLYWKQPEYAKYLTHPAATIRNLELLQNETFRASVQHPGLQVRLVEGFAGAQRYEAPVVGEGENQGEMEGETEDKGAAVAAVNGTGGRAD